MEATPAKEPIKPKEPKPIIVVSAESSKAFPVYRKTALIASFSTV